MCELQNNICPYKSIVVRGAFGLPLPPPSLPPKTAAGSENIPINVFYKSLKQYFMVEIG